MSEQRDATLDESDEQLFARARAHMEKYSAAASLDRRLWDATVRVCLQAQKEAAEDAEEIDRLHRLYNAEVETTRSETARKRAEWDGWIRFDSDCVVNGDPVKAGTSWGPFEKSRNINAAPPEPGNGEPTYAVMDAARTEWWSGLSKRGDPAKITSSLGGFGDGFFAGWKAASVPSATRLFPMRRIVCAAIRNGVNDIIAGPRHFDITMRRQLDATRADWETAEQGFLDQQGIFLTREQAHPIAKEAGQIIRRCGGDESTLYSENLY